MNIYFAPMEGITGYVYRNAHKMYFPSVEKYFAPFVSPTQHHTLNRKEKKMWYQRIIKIFVWYHK